jgi:hypothetical protein
MICPRGNRVAKQQANDYAIVSDFRSVFAKGANELYQLSFLLAANHEKAEQCFVAGLEDSVKSNRVFKEWARSWAKRAIIQNAIRELKPRPRHANLFSYATALPYIGERSGNQDRHFELEAVLALENFDRFVFVMSVLERYSEHDCTLLLGCTRREIEEARNRALAQLVDSRRTLSYSGIHFEELQETSR